MKTINVNVSMIMEVLSSSNVTSVTRKKKMHVVVVYKTT
jgi:hypothetical protein